MIRDSSRSGACNGLPDIPNTLASIRIRSLIRLRPCHASRGAWPLIVGRCAALRRTDALPQSGTNPEPLLEQTGRLH